MSHGQNLCTLCNQSIAKCSCFAAHRPYTCCGRNDDHEHGWGRAEARPDNPIAIRCLDAAALWEPAEMRELADTIERKMLGPCEAQYLRTIANRLEARAQEEGSIREVVLCCRSCGLHSVLTAIGQECECAETPHKRPEWHGWAIGHIWRIAPIPRAQEEGSTREDLR